MWTSSDIVAECTAVVFSEVPMNYECERKVFERAQELIRNRLQQWGDGSRLPREDLEIAARVVAGVSGYYLPPEFLGMLDGIFRKAQQIHADRVANGSTADYLEWLGVAAAARGRK